MFVAVEPIDMRRSIDGLVLAVTERLQQDAKVERALYAFANARRDRVKIIWRTSTGWCLLYTRLVELKPIANIVVKADYQLTANRARTGRDQFSVALGYAF